MGCHLLKSVTFHLKVALTTILIPVTILLLIPPFLLVLLYRFLLILLRPWLRPDLSGGIVPYLGPLFMGMVSLGLPPSALNLVVGIKLQGSLDSVAIRKLFERKFAAVHPELRSYMVRWGGYWFWKPDLDFDIENHVLEYGRRVRVGEINAVHVEWLEKAVTPRQSPWQILLVEEEAPAATGGGATPSHHLLFKFHHALSDGFAILTTLMGVTDEFESEEQLKKKLKPPPTPTPSRGSSSHSRLCGLIRRTLLAPLIPIGCILELARMICVERPELPWGTREGHSRVKPAYAERRPFITICSSSSSSKDLREGQGQGLSVSRLKQVARKEGVSFTAVILELLTGGLRGYWLQGRGRGSKPEVPEEVVFFCPVPVPEHPPGLTNYLWGVTLRLPTGNPDPRSRLRYIEAVIQDRKHSLEPVVTFVIGRLAAFLPEVCFRIPLVVGFGISNFPGPIAPVRIAGRHVEDLTLTVLAQPCSFYAGILSYNGTIRVSFAAERSLFQGHCSGDGEIAAELGVISDFMDAELQELENLEFEGA